MDMTTMGTTTPVWCVTGTATPRRRSTNAPTAPIPGAGQAPQVSALHLAMMHGAVYDAVNSIDGRHQPYLAGLPAASPGGIAGCCRGHRRARRARRARNRPRAAVAAGGPRSTRCPVRRRACRYRRRCRQGRWDCGRRGRRGSHAGGEVRRRALCAVLVHAPEPSRDSGVRHRLHLPATRSHGRPTSSPSCSGARRSSSRGGRSTSGVAPTPRSTTR